MTRFDLLYALATPALVPYLLWRRLRRGKYTESAAGMLGKALPSPEAARAFQSGSLWLHAVSYGEVNAARAVYPYLHALPALATRPLVMSTVTETGQAHARKSFPDAAAVTYFPADYSSNVRRFQNAFNPGVFVLLETELWPNFLSLAKQRGTRCFMLNAKLSNRSFPRYLRFRKLLWPALSALEGVCAQTPEDAERFSALGIRQVAVTGNCKFDLAVDPLSESERHEWMRQLGINPARRWIVAGSTHPGEEDLVLAALREVRAAGIDAGLIICPRHPDRFDDVFRLCSRTEFPTARASAPGGTTDPQILVLDQMGVLARAYGLGEIAIVAGSFCPVGGHNLLEAAAHRIPVIYGPDLHSQREIGRLFQRGGAGLQVDGPKLGRTCIQLFGDPKEHARQAELGYRVVSENKGSAARAAAQLAQWLSPE